MEGEYLVYAIDNTRLLSLLKGFKLTYHRHNALYSQRDFVVHRSWRVPHVGQEMPHILKETSWSMDRDGCHMWVRKYLIFSKRLRGYDESWRVPNVCQKMSHIFKETSCFDESWQVPHVGIVSYSQSSWCMDTILEHRVVCSGTVAHSNVKKASICEKVAKCEKHINAKCENWRYLWTK